MDLKLRPGDLEDAEACGRIAYEAFAAIAARHGFPADIPSPEAGVGLVSRMLESPDFYAVVAEEGGRVVGSNFLDERSTIYGIGPITVDPAVQDRGVGRALMEDVMRRGVERSAPGVRLLQAGYHARSLSLYAKLGFAVRDLLACMTGDPPRGTVPGYDARPASPADLQPCNALCVRVHGHDRAGELRQAIEQGTARVVVHDGRISGYATDLAFFAHAVGESNEDLQALLMSADAFGGPGILVPTSNTDLFGWCLDRGLRVSYTMTLMSTGLYARPEGPYLPSVLY